MNTSSGYFNVVQLRVKNMLLPFLCVWVMLYAGCGIVTDELNTAGNKKMSERDYAGAIAIFNKVLAIDSNNYIAHYHRGIAESSLGENKEAIKDYSRAINIAPSVADIYCARGNAEYILKDYKDAIMDYDASLKIKPVFEVALYKRGCSKALLKEYAEAIQDFNKDIEISKYDTDVHKYRAASYTDRGFAEIMLNQKGSACVDFNKGLELGDSSAYELINKYCQ